MSEVKCRYCDSPATSEGSIFHRGGCAGLEDVRLNRLQHDTLSTHLSAAQSRVKELEALIQRELPFATTEGRKTWAADARTALASALRRIAPYLDLVPPTAADQVREALAAYDAHVAQREIVQVPGGPQCSHAYAVEAGKCVGCGAEVG